MLEKEDLKVHLEIATGKLHVGWDPCEKNLEFSGRNRK